MRILAEGATDTGPARLGCKINLRVERDANSNCEIFLSDNIRKLLPGFSEQIPASIELSVLYDRSASIRESVEDVKFTLILTMCLAASGRSE